MKRISVSSTELYLKSEIKEAEEYKQQLIEENDIIQTNENIDSMKGCLKNEAAEDLIIEWNRLLDRALKIQEEAKKINLTFAKAFRLN